MQSLRKYKLRAECSADLGNLLQKISVQKFNAIQMNIEGAIIPDMEATFSSRLSLSEIRSALSAIEDGHVMAETVALESKYTGERGTIRRPYKALLFSSYRRGDVSKN